jgi:hypothetical protein
MTVFLPISSALAVAAVAGLALSSNIAARRIRAVETRLMRTDTALNYQTQLCETLLTVLVAARASLLPCPSCPLGADEPCVCDMRRRSLAAALVTVDQFNARHRSTAGTDRPRTLP